jgi:hypothetical protein
LGDNQGAIALGKNPEFHKRTKHIRRRYHFIREAVDTGDVSLGFVPTRQMLADVLTKAMTRDLHSVHRSNLGVLQMLPGAKGAVGNDGDVRSHAASVTA